MKAATVAATAVVVVAIVIFPSRPCRADELADKLAAAPALETVGLGEPVTSVRQGRLLWAPNPDGKTWDLLQIYFPKYGGPNTIVLIDLGSGEVQSIQTEAGWNFHLCPAVIAPDGRLFISILGQRLRQKICIYDPAANKLTIDAVPMPDELLGETHPLVLGTDGKIYAIGQHPSRAAAAAELDPETLDVTFYAPIGPTHEPRACWGYSGGADDRYIYVASGKIPWYLVAFDRQTGTWETLVETAPVGGYVSVSQRPDGCTGSASGAIGGDGAKVQYWLHEGKAVPATPGFREEPPWPKREAQVQRPLPPRPEVNTGPAVPGADGFAEIWVREAGSEKTNAAATGWRKFRFQVPTYAHSIYRLMELPDGRLFGTAGAYEGNFVYDPKTGQSKHLGKIHLSHYATTFSGGKIYMSGYPSSPLYAFDPDRPWTAGTLVDGRVVQDNAEEANPRQLLVMGGKELAGTHKMYAAVTAFDGKVFFGGRWIRDGSAGGVGWYDPASGDVDGFWQPLSNYQVTHMTTAQEGRIVVLSTSAESDPLLGKPRPDQGALFFLDAASGEICGKFEPVAGAEGTGPIAGPGGDRVLGWTENPEDRGSSFLYGVDVSGPKLVFKIPLPCPLPVSIGSNQQEAWDFRLGPDGLVWTFLDRVLVRIDPAKGEIQPLGRLDRPGRIAFSGGRIYLGSGTELRRIEQALPGPR